jgi:hypothetical protein
VIPVAVSILANLSPKRTKYGKVVGCSTGELMPTIFIVGFRGTGGVTNTRHPHFREPALVRAGHVAIGGVIPDKLIGFSPTPEAIEAAGGELALLELLKEHIAQVGRLQDDTAIFERAKELAAKGERTVVWQWEVEVADETVETIKQWYNEKKEAKYNFPDEIDGTFQPDEYNCALFPSVLGMPLPSSDGNVNKYIDEMVSKGAIRWQTNS